MRLPSRSDWAWVTVAILIVTFGILAPAYVAGQAAKESRRLACITVEASANELRALNAISRDLGLPHQYPVPPETPECAALLEP